MNVSIRMTTLFLLLVLAIVIGGAYWFFFSTTPRTIPKEIRVATLRIGNKEFSVKLARTPELRAKGLGGHEGLSDSEGMLFLFGRPDVYGFWMLGMKFPIDIIWIRGNRIVDISESIQPEPGKIINLSTYRPKEPADRVLEVNAGLAQVFGFNIGDKVSLFLSGENVDRQE